jgi:hypothetical protein
LATPKFLRPSIKSDNEDIPKVCSTCGVSSSAVTRFRSLHVVLLSSYLSALDATFSFLTFQLTTTMARRNSSCFEDGFRDHEYENFRERMNRQYKKLRYNERITVAGRTLKKFSRTLFMACLYRCHRTQVLFTYGPKNCLRLLLAPAVPRDRVVAKGEVCPTM